MRAEKERSSNISAASNIRKEWYGEVGAVSKQAIEKQVAVVWQKGGVVYKRRNEIKGATGVSDIDGRR